MPTVKQKCHSAILRCSMEESFEARLKDFSARRYEMTFIHKGILIIKRLNNLVIKI
jgi:hypothetical protein